MTISYKGLESSTRGKVLWQTACLTLIQDKVTTFQRLFGILLIYLPHFGLLAPQHPRAFPLMWSSLIGFQCVVRKVWVSKERLLGRKLFKYQSSELFFIYSRWVYGFAQYFGCFNTLADQFVVLIYTQPHERCLVHSIKILLT